MAAQVATAKHNVATTLNYWDDPGDGSKPTPIFIGKGRISNKRPHKAWEFVVSDVSGDEDQYTLDSHGFQYCQSPSDETLFTDEQQIKQGYYAECEALVKKITGARGVHIFNHKVRRGPTQWHHLGLHNLANRGPVTRTHVDQSYEGAERRLRWELPQEADDIARRRYQIINVWRPIQAIRKDPIAVADARSVPDEDLVGAEMTEDGFVGESWVVRHNPAHQWYYKHGMTPSDVLLIKCFDSDKTVARRALHSAFEDPRYQDCESRQSIETVDWMGKKVPVWSMPTINYGLLLSQDPSEVDKVVNACKEEGYFYLDLQGIDGRRMLSDQQETLKLMKRFFDAPLEAKNEFGLISSHLGYEPVGSRTGVAAGSKDGYEMLKVSRDEIQRNSPKIPAPVKNSGDLQVLENSIGSCNTITKVILSALSTGMGLTGASRFENSHRNEKPSTTTLSMMHYLPTELAGENRVGHQKHTDISTLTLLFSEQWGLQVRPPGTCGAREMGFVAPKPGCAFVHVGDSLRFASGMQFQSCIHRVVPFDPAEHRYSIAYFLRAEDDTMFIDSEGRAITAGQWHDEKFKAFTDPEVWQAMAPKSMILGGMKEDGEDAPLTGLAHVGPAQATVPTKA
ncbi:hypothetical protein MY4824_008233 [Beauveria thailandica]